MIARPAWALLAALVSLAPAALVSTTLAAQSEADLARVPVQVINGRLVAPCTVSTSARTLSINLFLEYDSKCGLQLHNQVAAGLRAEGSDGSTRPITVQLGDFEFTVERREHGDEEFYDDFTKYHAAALGENSAAGTVGAEILSKYFIVFDVANGFVHVGPPRAESPTAREDVNGHTVVPLTETNGLAWVPVHDVDGAPAAMAIGGARYDTVVDAPYCARFRKPAGDLPSLRIGGIELTEFVALRPERVVQVHPDGVAGVLGLNLLERFRVEVDRVNRVARFAQTAPAEFPESDAAFFKARAEEDADALADFLDAYPTARTNREAAELLLAMRLDEGAVGDDCLVALRRLFETYPEELRATAMLDQLEALREAGQPALAVGAAELGIPAGRKDRYPETVHKLHAQVGEILLERGLEGGDAKDKRKAWEHLLSAAFGTPEDGRVNLNLGRFYEGEGRLRRAYSRYIQAVIKPDSGPEALEALHRLESQMTGAARMSIDEIERLTAGKTHAFGAASEYRRPEGQETGRVVLVEFFTNANFGDATRGGAIGGALGNEGLVRHFENLEHAAFITYHLPVPELVPMVTEVAVRSAEAYGVGPRVHVINGSRNAPGAGRWRDKEKVFEACKKEIVAALAEPSDYRIEIEAAVYPDAAVAGPAPAAGAAVGGHRVRGVAKIRGPANRSLRAQVVLIEKGVLYPGRSEIVIHRNVARASLTSSSTGIPFRPTEGEMAIPFDVALESVTASNEAFLDELMELGGSSVVKMSMDLDPTQLGVVAFVRDWRSSEIVQARQVWATPPEAPPEATGTAPQESK